MNTNQDLLNLVAERLENMLVTIREARADAITPLYTEIQSVLLSIKQASKE